MPCYHPLDAFKNRLIDPINKKILFYVHPRINEPYDPIKLPCGQCVGCRLERSRQWAMRCHHESQLQPDNCFITLTFSPEALALRPNQWSLDHRDWQLFMKKFKSSIRRQHGKEAAKKLRFYMCGEYGAINRRPHYHACIFGFDFPDKILWKITKTGNRLYTSKSLEELWPYGFSTIGDVTFESAAYVARYIMKKINGAMAEDHYEWIDENSGEISTLRPEYTTMSRRPGIGRGWLDRYIDDVYPHDYVVINGIKMKPPKYYDRILELERPYEFEEIKENRELNAEKHVDNNTPERLNVREQVQLAKLQLLPRNEA